MFKVYKVFTDTRLDKRMFRGYFLPKRTAIVEWITLPGKWNKCLLGNLILYLVA
jgi:hypothetical protein